jgi:hypothetical protein
VLRQGSQRLLFSGASTRVAPLSAHSLMAVPAIVLFASGGAPVFCKLQYAKPRKRGSVPIKAPQSCHFLQIFLTEGAQRKRWPKR